MTLEILREFYNCIRIALPEFKYLIMRVAIHVIGSSAGSKEKSGMKRRVKQSTSMHRILEVK